MIHTYVRVLVKNTVFLLFCCETRAIARAPPLLSC